MWIGNARSAVLGVVGLTLLGGCGAAGPDPVTEPPPPSTSNPVAETPPAPTAFANPGGMWLPSQLAEPQHAAALKLLGLKLPLASMTDSTAHPLGAIVFLGGCSASFVSDEGLIITNHHCVTRALQHSSTKKENLVEDGFLAKSKAEERSNGPAARVYVTRSSKDVTQQLRKGLGAIDDPRDRYAEVEKRKSNLVAACEKGRPEVRCQVSSFYGGSEWRLIERLALRDIRLVYAPHKGIGNFGGEIDNWRWPRHTGDYSFYRAYVGKDGKPADFSKDNVPYRPKQYLKLASTPLEPGDLVWVAGFPANTNRLRTAFEVAEEVEWNIPRYLKLCSDYLPLLEKLGKQDAEMKLKGTPLERGLSNVQTYMKGSGEGLTQGGAAEQKRAREQALRDWVNGDAERKQQYGDTFARLEEVFAQRRNTRDLDAILREITRVTTLLNAADTIALMAEERPKPDSERKAGFQERDWKRQTQALGEQLGKRYHRTLEIELLTKALLRASELPTEQQPKVLRYLVAKGSIDEKNLRAAVTKIYSTTQLEKPAQRLKLYQSATTAQLKRSFDPLLKLALALRPELAERKKREEALIGELLQLRPKYVTALRAFTRDQAKQKGTPAEIAPDANQTLRISYGSVRGYRPSPSAKAYFPFTKLSGMLAKVKPAEPFAIPKRLETAAKAGKLGPYASDVVDGEVPVNFLADLDITGGNSGSATLNAAGELVGLAFDGNYEAMASDWLFMPSITRSIHVDIRYVLWLMDAVDGADRLLLEMGAKPSLD